MSNFIKNTTYISAALPNEPYSVGNYGWLVEKCSGSISSVFSKI